jgi:phosphatidylglycerophosphatase A
MKFLAKTIATFFGLGYFPLAPGTLTSLAAVFLYKLYLKKLDWPLYLALIVLLFVVGMAASTAYSMILNKKDPRKIVIDEATGQLLCLFRMNDAWPLLALSFVLFRFFDIVKPFPIKQVERLPRGLGIMTDDIVAAFYAGILVKLYLLVR